MKRHHKEFLARLLLVTAGAVVLLLLGGVFGAVCSCTKIHQQRGTCMQDCLSVCGEKAQLVECLSAISEKCFDTCIME